MPFVNNVSIENAKLLPQCLSIFLTASKNKNDKCVFLLYIEANSVSNSKGQKIKNFDDETFQRSFMEFSLKDLYAVQEIQAEENLFRLIVK